MGHLCHEFSMILWLSQLSPTWQPVKSMASPLGHYLWQCSTLSRRHHDAAGFTCMYLRVNFNQQVCWLRDVNSTSEAQLTCIVLLMLSESYVIPLVNAGICFKFQAKFIVMCKSTECNEVQWKTYLRQHHRHMDINHTSCVHQFIHYILQGRKDCKKKILSQNTIRRKNKTMVVQELVCSFLLMM